jgi:conjugative relaxase-like TrwC/TraI family protein
MTVSYRKANAAKLGYYTSELEDGSVNRLSGSEPGAQWWLGGFGSSALASTFGIRSGTRLDQAGIETLGYLADGFRPGSAPRSPLVRNAGSERRVALHDFTLSAPKSVSVAWALANDELRAAMEAAHINAAQAFLSVMSNQIHCRLGAGGQLRSPCPAVGVLFPHHTSRAQDPQLHIHCVVLNLTVTAAGKSAAIEVRRALHWIGAAACVYHCELARGLKVLGFRIRKSGMLFELQVVPDQLVREFSQRRRSALLALDQEAMTRGMAPGRAIATRRQVEVQVLRTRPKKSTRAGAVLRRWWRLRAGRLVGQLRIGECVGLDGPRPDGSDRPSLYFGGSGSPNLYAPLDRSVAATPELLKDWAAEVLETACRQDGEYFDFDLDLDSDRDRGLNERVR